MYIYLSVFLFVVVLFAWLSSSFLYRQREIASCTGETEACWWSPQPGQQLPEMDLPVGLQMLPSHRAPSPQPSSLHCQETRRNAGITRQGIILVYFILCETESHCISQVDLVAILLPRISRCWDCRCVPPCLAQTKNFSVFTHAVCTSWVMRAEMGRLERVSV